MAGTARDSQGQLDSDSKSDHARSCGDMWRPKRSGVHMGPLAPFQDGKEGYVTVAGNQGALDRNQSSAQFNQGA